MLEGGLISLIGQIAERILDDGIHNKTMAKIRPALDIMGSEFQVRRSNGELAELCSLSKYYFIKLFKSIMGVSPGQYYQKLIMDKSVNFLIDTSYNISEIANLCGFDDAFYFSRIFKKNFGISPVEYRKKYCC